jgi:hypothetical protein
VKPEAVEEQRRLPATMLSAGSIGGGKRSSFREGDGHGLHEIDDSPALPAGDGDATALPNLLPQESKG